MLQKMKMAMALASTIVTQAVAMHKRGSLGIGTLKGLVVGVICLIIIVTVIADSIGNFTGLTLLVVGFIGVAAALGILMKAFGGR